LEPWQKVFINLGNNTEVAQLDYHLDNLTCVDCHSGDNSKPNNMAEAHTGLIADPSEYNTSGQNSCSAAGCHETTSEHYKNSLHQQLWGERKMVAIRSGVETFAECPQTTKDGFNHECASCHATCGDCHISIPNSAGKGLINSHKFNKTPDSQNNCMACHGSRVAHDFEKDYHAKKEHFDCLDCHSKIEMHSAADENVDRYQYEHLPSCEESGCHIAGNTLNTANTYHNMHFNDLSCFVCHSQEYNNCTDCHVNHEWQTDQEYQDNNPEEDFKIGLNPIKTDDGRLRFKYATLRHIPIEQDGYTYWGSDRLPAYDVLPSWKYTSPHNVNRFTARTDTSGGKFCSESCHANNPDNRKYYLFRDSVAARWPTEVKANESVFVDGHLPSGWFY